MKVCHQLYTLFSTIEHSSSPSFRHTANHRLAEEEDDAGDDNQDPISTENIIQGGRRTRGKTIDFAEAAAKAQAAGDDPMDDDDDDEDFKAADDDDDDAMKHWAGVESKYPTTGESNPTFF